MDYTRPKNASGGAGGVHVVVSDFDISAMGSSKSFALPDDLLGFSILSIQGAWTGATGTLDGSVELLQSNDGSNFDETGTTFAVNSANGSNSLESVDFSGRYAGVKITKNNLTAGLLTLTLVVKAR